MSVLCMTRPSRHPTSKAFYFRKAIPERLRERAGMREFKRSLHTHDPREAKKRWAAASAEYDALIERLEAPPPVAIEAEPVGTASVTPGDLHALAGNLWRWLLERYAAEPAPPEAFSRIAPNGSWGATSEPWSGQRYQLVSARRLNRPAAEVGIVRAFVDDFLDHKSMRLAPDDHRAFCESARDAIDGALSDLQRRYRGDTTESPILARYPAPRPDAPRGRPKVTITGLIEPWAKGRENVRQRTRDEWERRLGQLSAFLGHDDAEAVTGKDLRAWRDHLRTQGYKAKTINESCLAPVRAIFATAEAEGVLTVNPLAGLKVALKEDKTKEKPRRPYKLEEAKKLLQGAREREDALRWLTWLMAYTGARINEVAQLWKRNVKREGSIPYLSFEPATDAGQAIKTSASRREVPLHPALIREGFLKWIEKQPDGPLFKDLPEGPYGKRGDAASKRYGRWLRIEMGIADKRVVGHSWRHFMEDRMRAAEVPAEVADSILGHSLRGERGTYGEGPPMSVKAKWMRKLVAIGL